jgi:membrane protein implicated in regulation of membrane protease activity
MRAGTGRYTVEIRRVTSRSGTVETWIIWVIIAAVLGAIEILTTTLAFGLVALAAIVAAIAGAVGADAAVQFGAFVFASVLGLGVARPFALRHVRQPPVLRTGTAALVGRPATVLEEVSGQGGRVRIGGEVWSARSYDETLVIPAGKTVDVMHIEGATALVYPRE